MLLYPALRGKKLIRAWKTKFQQRDGNLGFFLLKQNAPIWDWKSFKMVSMDILVRKCGGRFPLWTLKACILLPNFERSSTTVSSPVFRYRVTNFKPWEFFPATWTVFTKWIIFSQQNRKEKQTSFRKHVSHPFFGRKQNCFPFRKHYPQQRRCVASWLSGFCFEEGCCVASRQQTTSRPTPHPCRFGKMSEAPRHRGTIFPQFRNCHTVLSAVVKMLFLFCILCLSQISFSRWSLKSFLEQRRRIFREWRRKMNVYENHSYLSFISAKR